MSFFPSLMGDFEDDPFSGQLRQMNRMMNSFFSASPFGGMMGTDLMPFGGPRRGGNAMMPFGFPVPAVPDMDRMFQNIEPNGNCHSFSSSTVMTMTNGPDGQPQVYQASQSVRSGPGGIRETKKSVADSRSGIKKLAIGHHIGDRAHIMEREHNLRSGEQVENQEFINLEEEEANEFNREWENKTRNYGPANAIGYPGSSSSGRYGGGQRYRENPAILPPPSSAGRDSDQGEEEEEEEDDEEGGVSIVEVEDDEQETAETTTPNATATGGSSSTSASYLDASQYREKNRDNKREKSRKREHEPDVEPNHKLQKLSK